MPRIFLSHSSVDNREAAALHQWLSTKRPMLRRQIFLDIHPEVGMEPGEWQRLLGRKIASCEVMLCLLTENWDKSSECNWEYRTAVMSNKLIVGARLQPTAGLGEVSRYQRCELFPTTDGQPTTSIDPGDGESPVVFATSGLEQLLRYVTKTGFDWPPPDEPKRAPYRGWAPFERADAAVFFGRKAEVDAAVDVLEGLQKAKRSKLFVILGPSGTGKSSFLRAGVLPRLERDTDRFLVMDVVRPGRDEALSGASGLARSIHALRTRLGFDAPTLVDLKANWIDDSLKVRELLVECQQQESDDDATPALILPLDQAEELFSSEAGPEATALLTLASDLFTQTSTDEQGRQPLRLIVTATIRTDRYEAMQTAEQFAGIDAVLFNDLKPMRADRFRQIIEGPAERSTESGRRLELDPLLVERLLADATANTTSGGDTLPLLSGTLHQLYVDYGDDGRLDLAEYLQLGGIERVVQTVIDKSLVRDEPARTAQLTALRDAFIPWLATVSDKDEKLRRIALWQDLPPTSLDLIDKLVDARILNKDKRVVGGKGTTQQDVIEIALESFLRQWKELAGWLDAEAPNLKAADELLRAAGRWESHPSESYLYRDDLLDQAESLAATKTFGKQLVPAREFLLTSRRRATEEQERQEQLLRRNALRLRAVLAVAVVVALVAVGAFFWALVAQRDARREAQDATAQKLTAEAQNLLLDSRDGKDVQALQELLAANKLATDPDERPLLDALVDRDAMRKVLRVPQPVIGVAYAVDGKRLVMAQPNGPAAIKVWDTSAPGWQDSLAQPDRVIDVGDDGPKLTSLAISRDGRSIVAGTETGLVEAWNLDDSNPTARQVGSDHQGRVTSVSISSDGSIASAGVDGVVNLTGPAGGERPPIRTEQEIFAVAFSQDGGQLATGDSRGALRLYDVRGQRAVERQGNPAASRDGVMSVAFGPDGRTLATGGADGRVRVWDTTNMAAPVHVLEGHSATITALSFNATGTTIASVSNDRTVRLWDVASGQGIGDPMRGHGGLILAVAYVSDVVVSGGNEHTMRLWDGVRGQPLSTPIPSASGRPLTDIALSSDGTRIAVSGVDSTVRLLNADNGAQIADMPGHVGVVTGVAFSPDGGSVASAGFDGTVAVWQPGSGRPPRMLEADRPLTSVAYNAKGDRVAAAGVDGQIVLWDLTNGSRTLFENKDHAAVTAIAFSPEGEDMLASVSVGGALRMWRTSDGTQAWEATPRATPPADGKEALATNFSAALSSVAISSDGKVAAGGANWTTAATAFGFVQMFEPDGSPAPDPPMNVGLGVMDIKFSPSVGGDEGLVVASFDPYEVQLWNPSADAPRYAFGGHESQVVAVALSADGSRIVSASADGKVRVWANLPEGSPSAAVCAKLTAPMTDAEWKQWISEELSQIPTCGD